MRFSSKLSRGILILTAVFCGLGSAFFAFYTARLFYVTRGLRFVRAGGNGTYIGAIVFPLLSLGLAWGAFRCVRLLRRDATRN